MMKLTTLHIFAEPNSNIEKVKVQYQIIDDIGETTTKESALS